MPSIFQLIRRIGGLKAAPTTGAAGQLAFWRSGTGVNDQSVIYAHDGTAWREVVDTSNDWIANGSNIYRAANNVGFRQASPLAAADVNGSAVNNVIPTSGVMNLDLGQVYTATAGAAITWSFTNVPSGRAVTVVLQLTNGGAFTQTWPASVKWPAGTAPILTTAGTDVLVFVTTDGGVTWRGNIFAKDSK